MGKSTLRTRFESWGLVPAEHCTLINSMAPAKATATPAARKNKPSKKKSARSDVASGLNMPDASTCKEDESGAPEETASSHNKYCHFCQHVKIKKVRSNSMRACGNHDCSRRFCEYCLLTHLGEDLNPMSSDAWIMVDGKVYLFLLCTCTNTNPFSLIPSTYNDN